LLTTLCRLLAAFLFVGYEWVLVHRLQGRRADVRGLLAAFERRRIGHVFLAVLPGVAANALGAYGLSLVLSHLGDIKGTGLLSVLMQVRRLPVVGILLFAWMPSMVVNLALLPLKWAGLEVMVGRRPGWTALGRSAAVGFRNLDLLVGLGVLIVAVASLNQLSLSAAELTVIYGLGRAPNSWLRIWSMCAVGLVFSVLWLVLLGLATVLVYREMLWREREGRQATEERTREGTEESRHRGT
jgi:hypothetical protein